MSTTSTTTPQTRPAPVLSPANLAGLALAVVLALGDIVGAFVVPVPDAGTGEEGPPVGILVVGVLIGLLTIGLVYRAWRTGSRSAVRAIAGLRILSAITSLPALFVDIDAWVKVFAAVGVLLTIACVVLLLRPAARARVTD